MKAKRYIVQITVVLLTLFIFSGCASSTYVNRAIPIKEKVKKPLLVKKNQIAGDNESQFHGTKSNTTKNESNSGKAEVSLLAPLPTNYIISEGDALSIKFPYRPEFNLNVVVRPDGRISLPFIGTVIASGKTPETFNREVAAKYRMFVGDNGHNINVRRKQYRINPGDELEIKFTHQKDLNEKVTVRPDGRISLVIVRSIIAEGKTPEQLGRELRYRYKKSIKDPDLVVIVRKFVSNRYYVNGKLTRPGVKDLDKLYVLVRKFTPQQIYIGGEVNKPGVYPYRKNLTLMQSIIIAGGSRSSAEMRQVLVIRKKMHNKGVLLVRNLKPTVKSGNQTPALVSKAASKDIILKPFDVVIIPKTKLASAVTFMSQIYNLIPPLRNINFSFIYDLDERTRL